jgi:hypothetical protein
MSENVNIPVRTYDKSELSKVVNTQFTEFTSEIPAEDAQQQAQQPVSIPEFFANYSTLFYDIPKFGETNSHEYLVKTSSDYISGERINEELLALQNEITQLRQENLELQQYILNLQNPA